MIKLKLLSDIIVLDATDTSITGFVHSDSNENQYADLLINSVSTEPDVRVRVTKDELVRLIEGLNKLKREF